MSFASYPDCTCWHSKEHLFCYTVIICFTISRLLTVRFRAILWTWTCQINTNSTLRGFTVSAVKAVKASHWRSPTGNGSSVVFWYDMYDVIKHSSRTVWPLPQCDAGQWGQYIKAHIVNRTVLSQINNIYSRSKWDVFSKIPLLFSRLVSWAAVRSVFCFLYLLLFLWSLI